MTAFSSDYFEATPASAHLGAVISGVDLNELPDAALVEQLRAQRTALARAESLPPYTVFHDRTLRDMATCLPTTRDELLAIHGIGNAKADKYGSIFLDLIREYLMSRDAS